MICCCCNCRLHRPTILERELQTPGIGDTPHAKKKMEQARGQVAPPKESPLLEPWRRRWKGQALRRLEFSLGGRTLRWKIEEGVGQRSRQPGTEESTLGGELRLVFFLSSCISFSEKVCVSVDSSCATTLQLRTLAQGRGRPWGVSSERGEPPAHRASRVRKGERHSEQAVVVLVRC